MSHILCKIKVFLTTCKLKFTAPPIETDGKFETQLYINNQKV